MLCDVAFAFMYALIIFSHFLFLKSLNIVIDCHLHLCSPSFVQYIYKYHRTG